MSGSSLSIEGYARVRAEMEAGGLRDGVLARAGVSLDEWADVQLGWLDKMGAETERGRFELTNRFTQAFLERQREIAAPAAETTEPSPQTVPTPALGPAAPLPFGGSAPLSPAIPVAAASFQRAPTHRAPAPSAASAGAAPEPETRPLPTTPVASTGAVPEPETRPLAPTPAAPPEKRGRAVFETGAIDLNMLRAALPFMRSESPDAPIPAVPSTAPASPGARPIVGPPAAMSPEASRSPVTSPHPGPAPGKPTPASHGAGAPQALVAAETTGLPADVLAKIRGGDLPFARTNSQSGQSAASAPPQAPGVSMAPHAAPGASQIQSAFSAAVPSRHTSTRPGVGPSQPGVGPSQPGVGPSQPGVGPSQPGLASQPPERTSIAAPDPSVLVLSLEQYAALCAELAASPTNADAVFARYNLATQRERLEVDLAWRERLRNNHVEYHKWHELYQRYLAYWQDAVRRGATR